MFLAAPQILKEDLSHVGYLGAGGFGYVSLEKDKNNPEQSPARNPLQRVHTCAIQGARLAPRLCHNYELGGMDQLIEGRCHSCFKNG